MRITATRFVTMLGRLLLLGALAVFYLWLYYHTPTAREAPLQNVNIPSGTGLLSIAATLEEAHLIRHRWMFVLYVALLHRGPYLQAGEYALRATMSPAQIVFILRSGRVVQHPLTIPEGFTIRDVATLVAAKGLGHPQRLLELAVDPTFITSLGLSVPSLEGYLFPDTYHVPRGIQERDLLVLMVRALQEHYTQDIAAQAQRLGLSQHEVLTLASLVEKEAQLDEERPLIAAVYHNRLRRGMRLQCDPTVIYALGERFDGNLRKADLDLDSPYNTYRYTGLPPGPIAAPGRRSIEAAVAPAAVDYLYFVATGAHGRHQFSTTLLEHNQAVTKHQLHTKPSP
jgi:UPF0755 protein